MKLFSRTLNAQELENEKLKDYQRVVLVQILIVGLGMVLSSLFDPAEKSLGGIFVNLTFSSFGVLYTFLLWDMLRNFTKSLLLVRGIFLTLILIVFVGLLVENPFHPFVDPSYRRSFLIAIHGTLFPIEIIVIAYTIRDVFSGKFLSTDKLWGAACVYLMIGISFASLFDLINIILPGSLGEDIALGLNSYTECIYYSFNILGGLDTAYPNPSKLFRNLGVLEAVWGNLFAILIIGKLLTLPTKSDNQ